MAHDRPLRSRPIRSSGLNGRLPPNERARTGTEHYRGQRLEGLGTIYSSPVGVAGRFYVTDRDGNTVLIRHGPKFEVLATNSLDDGFDAAMAVVGDEILLRGPESLYSIARGDE